MQNKLSKPVFFIVSLVIIATLLVGCAAQTTDTATTGVVQEVSMSNSVESSGSIAAKQMVTLSWQTSGIVGAVNVATNTSVKTNDVLMTLDPATAPSEVIQATETLVSAKQDLENAKQSNTAKAQAELALANAQSAYNKALGNYWNRAETQGTADQITVAEAKLQIQDNKIITLKSQYDSMAELPNDDSRKALALQNYAQAVLDRQTLKTTLDYLRATPDSLDTQTLQANLNLAKAQLEDAQRAYNAVKDGPSTEIIASAQAKVDAAQSTVNMLSITAPFDGEVVAVQTQVGDQVSAGNQAIILVNRSVLYVDVQVDETQISRVAVGDAATVTFDALPGVTATGKVTFINPVGSSASGVVNYTVRITLDKSDPTILLGATSTIVIDTGAASNLLTVPVSAVQSDAQGEFVMRVNADKSTERVSIVSGTVVGTTVVVTGDLKAGDVVQLSTSTTTTSSSTSSSTGNNAGGGAIMGGPGF
ncbi:MAG: efflux RND transporter periplasmic adaptor subunit [Anaerolineaceae bacterium]